jgi:hypothetical protein
VLKVEALAVPQQFWQYAWREFRSDFSIISLELAACKTLAKIVRTRVQRHSASTACGWRAEAAAPPHGRLTRRGQQQSQCRTDARDTPARRVASRPRRRRRSAGEEARSTMRPRGCPTTPTPGRSTRSAPSSRGSARRRRLSSTSPRSASTARRCSCSPRRTWTSILKRSRRWACASSS